MDDYADTAETLLVPVPFARGDAQAEGIVDVEVLEAGECKAHQAAEGDDEEGEVVAFGETEGTVDSSPEPHPEVGGGIRHGVGGSIRASCSGGDHGWTGAFVMGNRHSVVGSNDIRRMVA